jgi:hypothetical protein
MLHCAWSRNRRACAECIIESPACLLPACQPGKNPISQTQTISQISPFPPKISRTCDLFFPHWRQTTAFYGFQNFKFKLLFLFVCFFFFKGLTDPQGQTRSTGVDRPITHCLPMTEQGVDWPITNCLPMAEHLFISSAYVLHFEWFNMLWQRYLQL